MLSASLAQNGFVDVIVAVNVSAGAAFGSTISVRLGDVTATVDSDAQPRLNLTAPTGAVALGSNINYSWEVCNTGLRPATALTLTNAPSGSNSGVFIFAPVPVGTAPASGQTFRVCPPDFL